MTREEKLQQAANNFSEAHKYEENLDFLSMGMAFEEGVAWADNNPKYSWINSNDELPTKGGHYLCMDDNHNVTNLAFCGDKWFNSRTFTDVPLEIVIYWMPIPKLPKE